MTGSYLTRLGSSIRKVDEDTIEVARFENGSMRWVFWFAFVLMSYFLFAAWWTQDVMWQNIRLWLDADQFFYESYWRQVNEHWIDPKTRTLEQYQSDILSMDIHKYRWISGMNFVLLWAFSFYLAFLINLRPVRFNRKYGVAYTYSWRGFHIARVGKDQQSLGMRQAQIGLGRLTSKVDSSLLDWGGLLVHLQSFRRPQAKPKPWLLGTYPALYAGQNQDLAEAIMDFMDPNTPTDWVHYLDSYRAPLTWRRVAQIALNFTLRPLYWPKRKTERLIQQHIARRSRR